MPHILLHHKVRDFDTWKAIYQSRAAIRAAAGIHQLHLLQGNSNPNDVVILFLVEDLEQAREHFASLSLSQAMAQGGVDGPTEILELR